MEAGKITLLNDLLGTNNQQYVIPIYQRKYKWTSEQSIRLIDDIEKAGKTNKEHFTGTLIYQQWNGIGVEKKHLVDGQQRTMTIMLILKALHLLSKDHLEDDEYKYVYEEIPDYIYINSKEREKGLVLKPSEHDIATFEAIMKAESFNEIENNPSISKNEENNLYGNFKTIYERLKKDCVDGDYARNIILKGLKRLIVVVIKLEKDEDSQAIFESINSLGIKLSNADLIRNYLLMSAPDQEELYKKYWKAIQDTVIGEESMESFVFDYLMMKKGYAINYEDIYREYIRFANEESRNEESVNKEKLLIDLYNVAKIYQPFLRDTPSFSASTNMLMQELRDMGQSTAYPFLMRVFLDKEAGIIDEDTLNKVINLIIVYLVRRTICGVPTRSLRGFMLSLYNRVYKIEGNKSKYYEAIYAFLSQLETNDRLRSESETKEALKTAEIYKNVKFSTYLLYKIENGRYPEPYNEFTFAKSVSVEHIMPQTLTEEWIATLGSDYEDIHNKYLNTLGNLSLSSQKKNSVMSNNSFIEKRDILLKTDDSKFVVLNKDFDPEQVSFGKEEIEKRGERLSSIVSSKFRLEKPDISGIKFFDTVEIICSTEREDIFRFGKPVSYKLFGKETMADRYDDILVSVARSLLKMYPEKMRKLASENYYPWKGKPKKPFLRHSAEEEDWYSSIGEDIEVYMNYRSEYHVQCAVLLLKEFGIEASQLVIYLKKDSLKAYFLWKKKGEIIREALSSLSSEGKIVYDPTNMPKSNDWIKFQTEQLNSLFPFEGKSKWDEEYFSSICYLDYRLATDQILIDLKTVKATTDIWKKLEERKEELGLLERNENSDNWYLKEYKIDYKAVNEGKDKVQEMKKQIESCLLKIKTDLDRF